MDVGVASRLTSDSSNYVLSSMELTETNEFNKNISESSGAEITDIHALKQKQIELEAEYNRLKNMQDESSQANNPIDDELGAEHDRLRTIHEESSQAINLVDDSESTEQMETHHNTNTFTSNSESESILTENTVKHTLDESCFFKHSLLELGRRLWKSTQDEQHYTKGCLWSPDGTCILTAVHLDGMHVMELPQDLYDMNEISSERNVSKLTTAVHVKESGTVYDLGWYPFMNSENPDSCCWLTTRQHEPIHLFDAFNGELRCSYRGYDQVDEVETAISVIFSISGEKVIGGYKKSIKIFDTNVPGRDYDSILVKKAVACFALSTQNEEAVTTGSWNGYIDHYDLRARQAGSLFTLGGHDGGITCLKYSKNEPIMLFSGARRDNKILQWDMRNFKQPLRKFDRTVNTNQRIYFDLSPQENWLISGDSDGLLRIWDLKETMPECAAVPVHKDCCNGANFHPTLPIIATSAGQYHFVDVGDTAPATENLERKIVKYENTVIILGINQSSF